MGGFSFGILVLAAVSAAMFFPQYFITWGNVKLKILIVPLLQVIMFGMGTAMSLKDFGAVVKSPRAVLIGIICQFTIMPLVGFSLARLFQFPVEIAAGIILIGSSPSGLASNVMAYIGKANLALSVTLTAVATLIAPIMTPLLMRIFSNQLVPIDFLNMMWGITKMVILPIAAGLLINKLGGRKIDMINKILPKISMAGIVFILTIITAAGRDSLLTIGIMLILASIIHNSMGYLLGYWSCKLAGLDQKSCRTIALEVGLQNAGLATGIAMQMGKLTTIGLAPAVFGPLMNITGSSLATYWREKSSAKVTE